MVKARILLLISRKVQHRISLAFRGSNEYYTSYPNI